MKWFEVMAVVTLCLSVAGCKPGPKLSQPGGTVGRVQTATPSIPPGRVAAPGSSGESAEVEATIRAFWDAVNRRDFQAASEFFSPTVRQKLMETDPLGLPKGVRMYSSVTAVRLERISPEGANPEYVCYLSCTTSDPTDTHPCTRYTELAREGGSWHIVHFSGSP